ncbi:MAG: nucleotidyltransferase family protein [Porcipelethomonas sp.]
MDKLKKKSAYDMLYLTCCVLNKAVPDTEKIDGIDLKELFSMCQFHSLTALVCSSLESAGVEIPGYWVEAKAKAIRKVLLLDAERERILNFMEENGIWYMPLKGVILKELYPEIGMRQMSDNDILYDKKYLHDVDKYMKDMGYTSDGRTGKYCHDEYHKPPLFNFELHTSLFGEFYGEKFFAYYSEIENKFVRDKKGQYAYKFTDEDFYIYVTAHEYKHYSGGGTGLRSLTDRYVYINKKENLDWNYIESELSKMDISDYERKARALSIKVFSSPFLPELSQEEKEMLEFYLFSGTYGTTHNLVKSKMEKLGKESGSSSRLKYVISRVFPPMEFYRLYYPFFYKHKILLPAGWVYRVLKGVTSKRKRAIGELNALKKNNK